MNKANDSVQSENIEPKETGLLTKEQIKEFTEQEKEADDSWHYKSLAGDVAEAGDKDWARKLYKKAEDLAEDLAEDSSDYRDLAKSIVDENYLGDKDWARKLYKKAEDLAEDFEDYKYLANSIADEDYLGDKEWARKLYKKAEDLAEDLSDYLVLAEFIANKNKLGDKDWAREVYKKAENLANCLSDYCNLAGLISDKDYLGDKDWARDVYKKAEELAEEWSEYIHISKEIEKCLDDKTWARVLLKKSEALLSDEITPEMIEELTDPNGEYDLLWDINEGYMPEDITTKYGNEELTSENFIDDVKAIFNKYPGLKIIEGHQFPDSVGSIEMNGTYFDDDDDLFEFFDKYFKDVALHKGADEDEYISIAIVNNKDQSFYVYAAKETST